MSHLTKTAGPVTVRNLIDNMAARRPDEAFLLSPETGEARSFLELQRSCRCLAVLLRGLGLEPGDKVAFLMDNGVFTAELFWGPCMRDWCPCR